MVSRLSQWVYQYALFIVRLQILAFLIANTVLVANLDMVGLSVYDVPVMFSLDVTSAALRCSALDECRADTKRLYNFAVVQFCKFLNLCFA